MKVGGVFLAMKSVDSGEELSNASRALEQLGGAVESVVDYPIPGTDIQHRLIIIKKIWNTPQNYPRTFAKIKKNPL